VGLFVCWYALGGACVGGVQGDLTWSFRGEAWALLLSSTRVTSDIWLDLCGGTEQGRLVSRHVRVRVYSELATTKSAAVAVGTLLKIPEVKIKIKERISFFYFGKTTIYCFFGQNRGRNRSTRPYWHGSESLCEGSASRGRRRSLYFRRKLRRTLPS